MVQRLRIDLEISQTATKKVEEDYWATEGESVRKDAELSDLRAELARLGGTPPRKRPGPRRPAKGGENE